jgi:predicted nucleic acid-binding protein
VRYVLDCSVALKWFLPEPLADAALHLLAQARKGEVLLCAPDVLLAEFGHGLRKHALGKGLPRPDAILIWQRFVGLGFPRLVPTHDLGEDALALALKHHATFYDALYVALALREKLLVVTADDRAVNAFASLGCTLPLRDLPR